jgi:nicotinamide riboside transporter PnuC
VTKRLFTAISISLPFLITVFVAKLFLGDKPLLITIIGTIMGVLYYVFIMITDLKIRELFIDIFNRTKEQIFNRKNF